MARTESASSATLVGEELATVIAVLERSTDGIASVEQTEVLRSMYRRQMKLLYRLRRAL